MGYDYPYTTGLFLAPNVHSVPEKVVSCTECLLRASLFWLYHTH